jgi:hypothetical protein
MRRNYISPEFIYKKVFGTLNMSEQSTFFGSKMLEIDDFINIKNDNIVYYQLPTGEQLDYNSESSLPQIGYDAVEGKKSKHKLIVDESQSDFEKNNNTKWILDIQIKDILKDYIFATMKKWRTFEGVRNNMTINNNVDASLREYIDKNVLDRYKFSKIEFYLTSINLLTLGKLKYDNVYDVNIESTSTIYTKFQTETDVNDLDIRLKFTQPLSSNQYAFSYYFNILFEKI